MCPRIAILCKVDIVSPRLGDQSAGVHQPLGVIAQLKMFAA
jgi:hypothetical protein